MSRTTGPIEASPDEHVERYSPPAYLSDFNDTLLDEWSHAVSVWFDEAIAKQAPVLDGQRCQSTTSSSPTRPPVRGCVKRSCGMRSPPTNFVVGAERMR